MKGKSDPLQLLRAGWVEFAGLTGQPGPPHAVAFDTTPIAFALRAPVEGFNPHTDSQPSGGVALWFHAPDAQAIHDALAASGVPILAAPIDGPFGRTFSFADPDEYRITLHDRR